MELATNLSRHHALFIFTNEMLDNQQIVRGIDIDAPPTTLGPTEERPSSFYLSGPTAEVVECQPYTVSVICSENDSEAGGKTRSSQHLIEMAFNHRWYVLRSSKKLPQLPYFLYSVPDSVSSNHRVKFKLNFSSIADTPDYAITLERANWMYDRLGSTYKPTLAEGYYADARQIHIEPGMYMPYGVLINNVPHPGILQVLESLDDQCFIGSLFLLNFSQSISPGTSLARVFTGSNREPVQTGSVVFVL